MLHCVPDNAKEAVCRCLAKPFEVNTTKHTVVIEFFKIVLTTPYENSNSNLMTT